MKNKLHAILHQHNPPVPSGNNPFSDANVAWWHDLEISPVETLQIRHFWLSLDHTNQLLKETESMIAQFP